MTGHNAPGQIVQIVIFPAKLISQRCQEHCAVCGAAGQHSICALGQTLHDRFPSIVDIGIHKLVLDLIEIAHIVHIFELAAVSDHLRDLIQQIVTGDITDLVAVHLLFLGHSLQSVHSAGDIHAAGIGNDADLLFIGLFSDLFHQADEISGVTGSGILHLLTLHDRQSQLRQIVASHVIQVAVTNHVDSSVRTVAPETLSASNGYFFHS